MISIFVASMNRPQMLERMLQSLHETVQGYVLQVVAMIDVDRVSVDVALKYGCLVNFTDFKRGALAAWNEGLMHCAGDILIPAGDDQVFHPNWLELALESHQNKLGGYGVVGMNDLAYNGNTQVATMWLFDRKYCQDAMGGIFAPPVYRYYCVDSEWNEKAKMLGRFYWDERSKVEHLHSAHGKRPVDDLDKEKMDAHWMELDNRTFEDRKSRGFPIEWESLI